MTVYNFPVRNPNKAYLTNNLLLPISGVLPRPVKAALTFYYGEKDIIDGETGEIIGSRPAEMYLWDATMHHLIVPRLFIPPEHFKHYDFEFVDCRPQSWPTVDIEDNIELRDEEQEEAFEALLTNDYGTLNLACGKGKTVLALKLAAVRKVPTLIVVNSTYLLEQWKSEIEEHLGVGSVGTIQGPNIDWKGHPITIAMVNTLALHREKWPWEFRCWFGLVLYDEGHHMSAPLFVRCADLFFGSRYSLTATANRTDGLESIYQYHLGGIIHSNLSQEIIPTTLFHKLKWEMPPGDKVQVLDANHEVNISRTRSYLGRLEWRNQMIFEDALKDLAEGRQLLILTHSVPHAKALEELFRDSTWYAGLVIGETPQGDRVSILRKKNPVIGTFQLAREGLNKPELDTLYVITPFSNKNDLQQSWGRIQRRFAGKKDPIVRVYEDHAIDKCVSSCRTLRRNLKAIDYPYRNKNINMELEL